MSECTASKRLSIEDAPDLLSVAQVAQVLGVGEGSVRESMAAMELPRVKIGGTLKCPKHLLQGYLCGLDWRDPAVQRQLAEAAVRPAGAMAASAPAAGLPDLSQLTPEQARIVGAVLATVLPLVAALAPAPQVRGLR